MDFLLFYFCFNRRSQGILLYWKMIQQNTHAQSRLTQSQNPIDIVFKDINYTIYIPPEQQKCSVICSCIREKQQKHILKSVSGICKAGQVTAIMGPSGAGKTTLLNAIAKRVDQDLLDGIITANGQQYSYERFGDFANYVMQNDILLETLTVRQTLEFAANLKINQKYEVKQKILMKLITNLKLQNCLDTNVGGNLVKGISGGQKKRTAIAFQLISDPQVLILDEPTSGLDSLTAFIIVQYLHNLATKENKTIIMTIHQPNSDIFELMDQLILLVEGQMVYQGPADTSIKHFQKIGFKCPQYNNPPDYLMSIVHQQSEQNVENYPLYFQNYIKQLLPIVKQRTQQAQTSIITKRFEETNFFNKMKALLKRDIINILRNPIILKARIIQTLFLGIFIGGLFFNAGRDYTGQTSQNDANSRALIGCLFFFTINNLMMALSAVVLTFPIEREVFRKQRGSRLYGVFPYFLSRNLVQLPYLVALPMIMCLIVYWMIGFSNSIEQFFTFYIFLFLLGLAGSSLGLFLGSVISDPKLVNIFIPLIILPLVLFSGFYKNRQDLPVWLFWIEYVSPLKYAFIGMTRNEVGDNELVTNLNFEENLTIEATIFILLGMSVGIRLLSMFFLWLLGKKLQ